MITICKECKHLICQEPEDQIHRDYWWNQFCGRKEKATTLNVVSGQREYKNGRFPYAKDVNKGQCPDFDPKEKVEKDARSL